MGNYCLRLKRNGLISFALLTFRICKSSSTDAYSFIVKIKKSHFSTLKWHNIKYGRIFAFILK